MTPYFTGKMRKYFFRLRDGLFLLAQKVPSLIWNWEAKTHPIFKKNLKKYFFRLWNDLFYLNKVLSLIWNLSVKTQPIFRNI